MELIKYQFELFAVFCECICKNTEVCKLRLASPKHTIHEIVSIVPHPISTKFPESEPGD
jgi:hypothetical protein